MCTQYGWHFPGVPALHVEAFQDEEEAAEAVEAPSALEALLAAAVMGGALPEAGGEEEEEEGGKKGEKKRRRLRPRKHARRLAAALARTLSMERRRPGPREGVGAAVVDELERQVEQEEEEEEDVVAAAPVPILSNHEALVKEDDADAGVAKTQAHTSSLGWWAVPVAGAVAAAAWLVVARA